LKHEYVNNKEFTEKLGKHTAANRARREKGLPNQKADDYIGKCILDICTNICFRPNFIGYPFREEMSGDAIENCIRYINNFNSDISSNAFGYVSRIAYFACVRRIKKEKDKYLKHLGYIRDLVDEDLVSAEITLLDNQSSEYYREYREYLQSTLDMLDVQGLPERRVPKEKKPQKIQTVLQEYMDD